MAAEGSDGLTPAELRTSRGLEQVLRQAGYSRAEARAIVAGGFRGLGASAAEDAARQAKVAETIRRNIALLRGG